MKVSAMEAELFHADGWTDMTKLIVAFRNAAKTPSFTKYCVTSTLNQVSTVLSYIRRDLGSILRLETLDPNRDCD
jgi:hypothetical protein